MNLKFGRPRIVASYCATVLLSTALAPLNAFAEDARLAPDFALPAITDRDQTISLSDYRGKAVVVDFWSSWCAPCRAALPLLNQLHRQLAGDDFEIIAVNLDVNPADGLRMMEEYSIAYPVASDVASVSAKKYDLSTLPASFIIDRDGVMQSELPILNQQNFSAIKASLTELIRQESKTRSLVN